VLHSIDSAPPKRLTQDKKGHFLAPDRTTSYDRGQQRHVQALMLQLPKIKTIRRLATSVILCAITAALGIHVLDTDRDARLAMLEQHHARIEASNLRMRRANNQRARQLESLQRGGTGWQDIARHEHGMISEGEVIFHFPTREH
jgi:cell division protein FtsB